MLSCPPSYSSSASLQPEELTELIAVVDVGAGGDVKDEGDLDFFEATAVEALGDTLSAIESVAAPLAARRIDRLGRVLLVLLHSPKGLPEAQGALRLGVETEAGWDGLIQGQLQTARTAERDVHTAVVDDGLLFGCEKAVGCFLALGARVDLLVSVKGALADESLTMRVVGAVVERHVVACWALLGGRAGGGSCLLAGGGAAVAHRGVPVAVDLEVVPASELEDDLARVGGLTSRRRGVGGGGSHVNGLLVGCWLDVRKLIKSIAKV